MPEHGIDIAYVISGKGSRYTDQIEPARTGGVMYAAADVAVRRAKIVLKRDEKHRANKLIGTDGSL